MTIDWSGIFHILATPFTDDAALDLDGVPKLIESVLATGVRGITILGIAGEAHRLNDEERRRMVEAVVKEVRGRVPVVVGVSASGTHLASGFAAMARAHGADAVMVAPPAGARNLDAVAEYYEAVMRAAQCPLVLQDEPVTTQVTMPAPFLVRLIAELPAVQAVKLEEAPTLPKITRLRELASRRVAIFGGLGGVYFFEELSRGADGAMTGFPYPEALGAIREHFVAGPAGRGAHAVLSVAAAHPLRDPAGCSARHLDGHPQGDPPPPRLDRLRARAPAGGRARSGDARRADGAAVGRRHELSDPAVPA